MAQFRHHFVCRGTAIVVDVNGNRYPVAMRQWQAKTVGINNMRGGINKGAMSGKNVVVKKATVFVYVIDKEGGEHFVRKKVFRSKNQVLGQHMA